MPQNYYMSWSIVKEINIQVLCSMYNTFLMLRGKSGIIIFVIKILLKLTLLIYSDEPQKHFRKEGVLLCQIPTYYLLILI